MCHQLRRGIRSGTCVLAAITIVPHCHRCFSAEVGACLQGSSSTSQSRRLLLQTSLTAGHVWSLGVETGVPTFLAPVSLSHTYTQTHSHTHIYSHTHIHTTHTVTRPYTPHTQSTMRAPHWGGSTIISRKLTCSFANLQPVATTCVYMFTCVYMCMRVNAGGPSNLRTT